jgi:hypothetical protein
MVTLVRSPQWFHCGGGETGVAICPVDDACRCDAFVPRRGRLHHFCFRTKTREDVAAIPAVAVKLGAQIIGSPREADAAAGSYSVLFEDPEGLRIEANPIPGKGHLESSKPGGASAPLGPPARRRLLVVVARAYLDGRDD